MFTNLKTVLYQKGISLRQYAQFLGVSEKTIQNKLNGITDFTYPEFRKTCILLLPEYNADFLFSEALSPPPACIPQDRESGKRKNGFSPRNKISVRQVSRSNITKLIN